MNSNSHGPVWARWVGRWSPCCIGVVKIELVGFVSLRGSNWKLVKLHVSLKNGANVL